MRGGGIFDSPELRQLWNKARAALTKDPPPEDPKKTLTLEVRPEEVKVLYEDQSAIALKLAEYISRSDQNEARLARLKDELQMFTAALAELKQEKDNLQAQSA